MGPFLWSYAPLISANVFINRCKTSQTNGTSFQVSLVRFVYSVRFLWNTFREIHWKYFEIWYKFDNLLPGHPELFVKKFQLHFQMRFVGLLFCLLLLSMTFCTAAASSDRNAFNACVGRCRDVANSPSRTHQNSRGSCVTSCRTTYLSRDDWSIHFQLQVIEQ